MRLDDLIEQLEDIRDSLGTGEGEVYVATQWNYPLTNAINNVVPHAPIMEEGIETTGLTNKDVWIAADQVGFYSISPYAPSQAWEPQ